MFTGEVVEQRSEGVIGRVQPGQQRRQRVRLGRRHRGEGIERGENEPFLVLAELDVGHRDGRLPTGEGELEPEMPVDDVARRAVDEDLGDPADLPEGAAQRPLLVVGVGPPVPRVRHERGRVDLRVPDDPVAPRQRRRHNKLSAHPEPRTCIVAGSE